MSSSLFLRRNLSRAGDRGRVSQGKKTHDTRRKQRPWRYETSDEFGIIRTDADIKGLTVQEALEGAQIKQCGDRSCRSYGFVTIHDARENRGARLQHKLRSRKRYIKHPKLSNFLDKYSPSIISCQPGISLLSSLPYHYNFNGFYHATSLLPRHAAFLLRHASLCA